MTNLDNDDYKIFLIIILAVVTITIDSFFTTEYRLYDNVNAQTIEDEIMANTLESVEKATAGIPEIAPPVNDASRSIEISTRNLTEPIPDDSSQISEGTESALTGVEDTTEELAKSMNKDSDVSTTNGDQIGGSTLEDQLKLASEYLKNQQSLFIKEPNNLESNISNNKSIQFFKSNAYSPNTEANIINDQNSDLKIFESNITGIKLKYPSNWYFENNGYLDPSCIEQICKIVLYPYIDSTNNINNNDHSVGFIISSGSSNNPKFKEECKCDSLVEFVQSTYVKFFGNNENLSFVNDNQTTIAENTSAWQLEFDIKNIDNYDNEIEKQGKMWTVWTLNDNAFYHIAYVADKESYSKYLSQAKQVVKSIEFIPIDEEFKILKSPSFMLSLDQEEEKQKTQLKTTINNNTNMRENIITNETLLGQGNFTVSESNRLTILSHDSYIDSMGDMHVIGEVKNNAPKDAQFVEIIGTFYDNNNKVVGTSSGFTTPTDLSPGEIAPFDLILYESSIPQEQIERYVLKVSEQ